MKKISVKLLAVLCALCTLLAVSVPNVGAITFTPNVNVRSEAVLMVHRDVGQVVYEKNADEKRYPASTTKIMTFIVAYEHIPDLDNTQIPIKKAVLVKLKNTDSSVAEIAEQTGYANLTYFYRIFRKAYGITPHQMRREEMAGSRP